jgi:hypothetical protein
VGKAEGEYARLTDLLFFRNVSWSAEAMPRGAGLMFLPRKKSFNPFIHCKIFRASE